MLYIFIVAQVVLTFLPATGHPHWFFRIPDFLRSQLITIQIFSLLALVLVCNEYGLTFILLTAGLVTVILYQLPKIIPYTFLYSRRKKEFQSDGRISILAANVLQTNRNYERFISLINSYGPDLVITMETDKDWEKGLKSIESTYEESIKIPKSNFYGMHVYSKLPLKSVSIKNLITYNP